MPQRTGSALWFIITALFITGVGLSTRTTSATRQTSDETQLGEKAASYLAAIGRKDLETLVRMWSERSPFLVSRFAQIEQLDASDSQQVPAAVVSNIQIEADRAILLAAADNTPARRLAFVREDGEWKVWRDADASDAITLSKDDAMWKPVASATPVEELARALALAATDSERDELLDGNPKLLASGLWQALGRQGERLYDEGRRLEALNAHRLSYKVAERVGNLRGMGEACEDLGDIARSEASYKVALDYYTKAARLFDEAGEEWLAAEALERIGLVFMTQGNYDQALETYRTMLARAEASKDRRAKADALDNIANAYYDRRDYDLALEYFIKSLALRREFGNGADAASSLASIGNVYYQQGNLDVALDHYRQSLERFKAVKDDGGVAAAHYNIANVQHEQGNYDRAVESYQRSLAIEQARGFDEGVDNAVAGLGHVQASAGNYSSALEYYRRSLSLRERLGDKKKLADAHQAIGIVTERQGDIEGALAAYEAGLKLYQQSANRAGIAAALSHIGGARYVQGDLARSLDSYKQALVEYEALNVKPAVAATYASLGNARYSQSDYGAALENYQKSLALYESLSDKEGVAAALDRIASAHYSARSTEQAIQFAARAAAIAKEIDNYEILWRARFTAGAAHRALNQAAQARAAFEESIEAIEAIRSQLRTSRREQAGLFEDGRAPYVAMIELLLSQNKTDEAFGFAERANNRQLLDVLESGRVETSKGLPAARQIDEQKIKGNLVSLQAQVDRERARPKPDRPKLERLKAQLDRARLDYGSFQKKLSAVYPRLKALRGEPRPLSMNDARELIEDTGSALLEFVVAGEKSYLFALTKQRHAGGNQPPSGPSGPDLRLTAYVLDISRKQLSERTAQFRESIARRDGSFENQSRDFYDLLIRSASEQLKDQTSLCIVPDGALWELPFPALAPGPGRLMIEDHAISFAPSLSALREMVKPRARRVASRLQTNRLLAIVPPLDSGARSPVELYGARQSNIYGDKERIEIEAGKFEVLHFATRCLLDNRSPTYSRVSLSTTSWLEAREVAGLDVKADLVVLSLCETGPGKAGAGAVGMAWGWFIAGCPATVLSQWDQRSHSLMIEFHRELIRRGLADKAEALRQAMLKMIADASSRDPFYWAGFQIIGSGV